MSTQVCPECESSRYHTTTRRSEHSKLCRECGLRFDDPIEVEGRNHPRPDEGTMARQLLDMDPDDLDVGSEGEA